ncbi:MAG: glycosyltransferase [Vicinamibacterales bacterium]
MSDPLVSVVIPVHNGERFLPDALRSVCALDLPDLEIIVVDDGSTDGSIGAADFAAPIRIVSQERSGPAAARNHGLRLARGPIVGLLDADDRWTPAVAQVLLPLLLDDDSVGIAQGRIQEFRNPGDDGAARGPYEYLNLGSALYRRSVFEHVGWFDESLLRSEDYDWMLRAFDRRVRKVRVADTTLFYRIHDGGITFGRSLHDRRMAYVHKKAAARRRADPDLSSVPPGFPPLADYIGRGAAPADGQADLELTRCDARPIDPPPDAVLAFMVIRNEARRLPQCLEHHRRLGVSRFFIVDNGSDDGSAAWLMAQPDVHVWRTTASFGAARCGTDWIERLLREHGQGHWCLVVDADELLVYPDCEATPLRAFCTMLERNGYTASMATMIDMYSDRPIRDTPLEVGRPLLDVCPYFDRRVVHDTVPRFHEHDQHPSLFGGVRRRVFGGHETGQDERFFYCLNKVPLLKYTSSIALSDNLHWTSCRAVAVQSSGLLHFKFTADFADAAVRESQRQEHWKQGAQYVRYADAIRRDGALTLFDRDLSIRYEGTDQLVRLGVLRPPVLEVDAGSGSGPVAGAGAGAGPVAVAGAGADAGSGSGMIRQVRALIAARRSQQRHAHADAMTLLKCGNWQGAADAFRMAIAESPDFSWSHHYLGDALMALRQWTDAAASYSRAIELNPHFAPSHFNLGEIRARLEQWPDAADCYRRALDLQSDLPNAARNLARALVRQAGQLEEEAQRLYGRAHELAPADMAIYSEAVDLRPPSAGLFLRFADALAELDHRTKAIFFYQLALQHQPDDAAAHARLARVLRRHGDTVNAIECCRRAVVLDDRRAECHAELGAMLAEVGRTDDAIAAYRRSVALEPDRPAWLKELGDLLARAGRLDEAAAAYAQALSRGYQPY